MDNEEQVHDDRGTLCAAGGRTWATVRVPVVAARSHDPENTMRTIHCALSAVARFWRPANLRFVMAAGGGLPAEAAWIIGSDSMDRALELAEDLRTIVLGFCADLTLGSPAALEPGTADAGPAVADFEARVSASPEYFSPIAPGWRAALADDRQRWTLSVDVDVILASDPVAAERPVDTVVWPEIPTPTALPGVRLAAARVRLHGGGPRVEAMVALFAEDSRGRAGLQAVPTRSDSAALTWLPIDLLAHLLAGPCRTRGAFPVTEEPPPAALFDGIEDAATPHVLVLGQSGQGKSVLLSHLVERACARRHASFTIDVHDGELARGAARSARRHGMPVTIADFSVLADARRLDLTAVPEGVTPDEWSAQLYRVLRSVIWESMPDDYFGPVGERSLRAMLNLVVLDPAHELRLWDLPRLLSPNGKQELVDVLERIDRDEISTVVRNEIMPMLHARDAGNAAIFLLSKLTPLIDDPAIRAISSSVDTLGVEDALRAGAAYVLHAPASTLGDTGSRLVAAIVAERLWLAMRRRPTPSPVHVVGDEWQLYATGTFEAMLGQGRKFGARLRIANQNLAQLPAKLREAALGNCGSLVCFRVGPSDAALVDGLFPTIPRARLQTLPAHHAAVSFGDRDLETVTPAPH